MKDKPSAASKQFWLMHIVESERYGMGWHPLSYLFTNFCLPDLSLLYLGFALTAKSILWVSQERPEEDKPLEVIIKLFPGFVKLTLLTLMLTMGLGWTLADVTWLWQRPGLLFRSLAAVVVLVPVYAGLVLKGLIPPGPSAIAIGAMVACPGAPLLPKKSEKAGGNPTYIASLQITLLLVSVFTVPITVAILSALFPEDAVAYPQDIAKQVAGVQLLPLGFGILIRHFWSDLAETLEERLSKISNAMFLVLVILLLATQLERVLRAPITVLVAIALINLLSLVSGHFLGGPDRETRAPLALAALTRNAGLALFLASFNFPSDLAVKAEILNFIIVYALVAAIVAIPYSVWCKKQLRQQQESSVSYTSSLK